MFFFPKQFIRKSKSFWKTTAYTFFVASPIKKSIYTSFKIKTWPKSILYTHRSHFPEHRLSYFYWKCEKTFEIHKYLAQKTSPVHRSVNFEKYSQNVLAQISNHCFFAFQTKYVTVIFAQCGWRWWFLSQHFCEACCQPLPKKDYSIPQYSQRSLN